MKKILLAISLLAVLVAAAQDGEIPARPNPPQLVNDYTKTLTPAQLAALEQKLIAYDDSTSSQIAIVIVSTTGSYSVADFANRTYRNWGIGGKEHNNGVLILVALEDRKMHIEVGYGLEGSVTDYTAKSIIDNDLTPQFREGNYYRGLDLAVNDIIAAAAGEYKAPQGYGERSGSGKGIGLGSIIFLIVLFILIGGMGGGRGRGGNGMASAAGWIIGSMLSGGSRGWSGGGGGGWSGGGGGFGGFGGGSSGGGGASGSW